MNLIDELFNQKDDIKFSDDFIYEKIDNRCRELINKYPDKKYLSEDYFKKQIGENEVLENRIICSTMVIKRH